MMAWKTTVRKNQTITLLRVFDHITYFFRIVKSVGREPIFELAILVWTLDPNNVPMLLWYHRLAHCTHRLSSLQLSLSLHACI